LTFEVYGEQNLTAANGNTPLEEKKCAEESRRWHYLGR
jgi:hypothetical protein